MVVETLSCTTEIGAERPLHKCGRPMSKWMLSNGRQRWRCRHSSCDKANLRWRKSESGRATRRKSVYAHRKTEKGRETVRRHERGTGYVTTRRRELLAQRERVTNQLEEIREELNAWR